MKLTSIIGLAALAGISQASCHKLRVKMQAYDEESCHQNAKLRGEEKIKVNECQNFGPFRSYQVSPYHGELKPGCHIEVFDTKDCKGRSANTPNIMDAPNVCTNATFPLDIGLHSGRSAKLVCDKASSSSALALSTMIKIPYIQATSTMTITSTMSPTSTPFSEVSIIRVMEDYMDDDDDEVDVLTVTKTSTIPVASAVVHLVGSAKKSSSTSYSSTSTVFVQPIMSTSTVIHLAPSNSTESVSTKPSTTKTFCFTTAFKGKPAPTRRSVVEESGPC